MANKTTRVVSCYCWDTVFGFLVGCNPYFQCSHCWRWEKTFGNNFKTIFAKLPSLQPRIFKHSDKNVTGMEIWKCQRSQIVCTQVCFGDKGKLVWGQGKSAIDFHNFSNWIILQMNDGEGFLCGKTLLRNWSGKYSYSEFENSTTTVELRLWTVGEGFLRFVNWTFLARRRVGWDFEKGKVYEGGLISPGNS
jgi:hypothetical protein